MRFKRAIIFAAVFASVAGIKGEAQSDPASAPGWNGPQPQPGAITPFSGNGEDLRPSMNAPSAQGGDLRPPMNQGAPMMAAPVQPQTSPMMGAPVKMKKHKGGVVGAAVGLPDRTAKTGVGMTDRTAKTGAGMVDRTAKTGVGLTDRAAKTTVGLPAKATKEVLKVLF